MSANPIAVARSLKSLPLDARSQYLRRLIVDALVGGERGHIGSSMSPLEILRVLYDDVLHHRPKEPHWPERDRCILSKGHGCLALYVVLADKGYFPIEVLKTFCRKGSILGGHPEYGKVPGVEASTGSLGHGLSIGVGMALAARMRKRAKEGRCEGRKPFGYYEGEAAALDRMKALRAEGLGFDRIAARLNDEHVPTRTGRPWHGVVLNRILTGKGRLHN